MTCFTTHNPPHRAKLADTAQNPRRLSVVLLCALCASAALLFPTIARGVQIQDLVRIKGHETSKIVGMGLVVGLPGTGDGGDFLPAMRPMAKLINTLIDPTASTVDLGDGENVALVSLSAEIPAEGVREGDKIDVQVSSVGPAESLAGGRLLLVPMIGPSKDSPRLAYAEGPIVIENAAAPTAAVVFDGAQMTRDIRAKYLDPYGRMTLVVTAEDASWSVANNIANLINDLIAPDGPAVAEAQDAKNIVVDMPRSQQQNPAPFISQILSTYIDPSQVVSGARVVINERTGTIIFSDDVQISPVGILHEGLSVTTITPEPEPTPVNPQVETRPGVILDPDNRGGARLSDLMAALDQLKVDSEGQISILKAIDRAGRLHAKLIVE
ncbi:MAG: flagellar basal body P-ring protein FlgI [Phycisphaeraceae bacterium]